MVEVTFNIQSVKYQGKSYKGCRLYVNDNPNELRITATKNRIFFLNRQIFFVNKSVPLLSRAYDATSKIDVQEKVFTFNGDIVLGVQSPGDCLKITALIGRPKKEADERVRQVLLHAEDPVRSFLATREEALGFLFDLRANPRKVMLNLSSEFAYKQVEDPVEVKTKLYLEKLSKTMDALNRSLSDVETQAGKDQANKLYAITYFVGKLQEALFQGRDPARMEQLRKFALELGFNDAEFEVLAKKNIDDEAIELFRNTPLINISVLLSR